MDNEDAIASYNGYVDATDTRTLQWYSYGNYYSWHFATAGNDTYSKESGEK